MDKKAAAQKVQHRKEKINDALEVSCMAHRGFSSQAPENTLSAIKKALELPYVDSIEVDVQLSKDGIPVVIHDFTLDRTTNGVGYVKYKTFAELRKLDAGRWFSKDFIGEKIPSLEEVLMLTKDKNILLNIELKTAGELYEGVERAVVALVKRYKMENKVYLTSYDHEVIRNIKKLKTKIRTGLIIEGNPVLLSEQLENAGAEIISIKADFLTPKIIMKMMKKNIKIITWTVNDPSQIQYLLQLSKKIGICTNYPDRLEAFKSTMTTSKER
ncbi:MAG: glycerophosphodiester phosphodiesterase family protein [Bacillota bacterium]|nr:glycerophosphodiester phosphodiesterase family protein [Bacillota bacterium]